MSAPALVYLIGPPGSGKSTLMAALTAGIPSWAGTQPFAHVVYGDPYVPSAVQLGKVRPSFSGTDALSMAVQPLALRWLNNTQLARLILGEGDRLGNRSFLMDPTLRARYRRYVVLIDMPWEMAAERRAKRAAALGVAEQNPTWLRGRYTKVANLADDLLDDPNFVVLKPEPVEALVRSLLEQIPELRRLTEWQAQVRSDSADT